jgi:hypothetical protein
VLQPLGRIALARERLELPVVGKDLLVELADPRIEIGEDPDLPGNFGPLISGKMAPSKRGADEEEPFF